MPTKVFPRFARAYLSVGGWIVCRLDFKPPKTDNRRQTQEVKAQSSTVYNSWVKAHKSMGPLLTYAPFHTVTVRHTPSETHTTVHTHIYISSNYCQLSVKMAYAFQQNCFPPLFSSPPGFSLLCFFFHTLYKY